MFGNFFKKGRMEENRKADADYVQDAASSLLANVDPAGTRIDQFDQASLLPERDRWADERAPEKAKDRILGLKAQAWFGFLPQGVRPHKLAKCYPRICNHIAERWEYPDLMIRFFDALLTDARGGRRGFPMAIAIEIAGLKEHYLTTGAATSGDVWNRVIASRMS